MHTVIETRSFITATAEAGMTAEEVAAVISMIAADPEAGEMMVGTGGVRKVRFAGRGKGKSGGYRVVTYYAAPDVPVFLLDCYKGDKANLSKAERNDLAGILADIAAAYRASTAADAAKGRA